MKTDEAIESAKKIAGNFLSFAVNLKNSNPKVFYGGIAALVLIIMILSGGGSNKVSGPAFKQVSVGQNFKLKSANAAGENSVIKLVSAPASMAAYDDTEESDRTGCKTLPEGTPVKVIRLVDAYGKKDAFAEVEIQTGECQGRTGWTLSINLN
ncbi:MAG: hypothetical protein ACU833_02460 [Gammaproteobacteria bacterium]